MSFRHKRVKKVKLPAWTSDICEENKKLKLEEQIWETSKHRCLFKSKLMLLHVLWTSLVAHTVKCLPTRRETRVQPLVQEDPLEKEMATHFSILAWRIPWTEEPDNYSPWGRQGLGTT